MKNNKIILILILCLILNIFTTSTFADDEEVYKVVGDHNFPPYEYVDSNGVYKGFNIDILKAIGLVTGMNFRFLPMRWEDAYNSINIGEADIIQGMKESEERKIEFLFTNSLLMNSQSIFVLNNSFAINNKNDLRGKKIGLMSKDSGYYSISNIKDVEIMEYDSLEETLDALFSSEVDAIIGNTLTINYICKERESIELIKIVGDTLNEQKYAIAVAKDNSELLYKLNVGLDEIQKNGMYDSLYRKWFGTPIRNTRAQSEMFKKIIFFICIFVIALIIIFESINLKLKKIIEDKTQQQKVFINELRRYDKMQFMDKIISSLAHEIRNPLTSIKIYTSLMKEKIDNREFMIAASEDIPEEINRIDDLIQEFMEYTSPRNANITDINLLEETMNTLKLVKLQIDKVKIIVNIDKSYYIKFDINHFKQVIFNILLNSKDAVKDIINPIIEIYAEENEENILLYIKDNGYGMDDNNIQYIFEPFYTTKITGNGVGMFVVKQIVEENLGKITAKSHEVARGMCIIITAERGHKNVKQNSNS